MATNITYPASPGYVKDGIIIHVESDEYTHIKLEITVNGETYTVIQKLFSGETDIDIAEFVAEEGKMPTLTERVAEDKIYTEYTVDTYGITETGEEIFLGSNEGWAYQGTREGRAGHFLTRFTDRKIIGGDEVLLYIESAEAGENTVWINTETGTQEYNISLTGKTFRIYLDEEFTSQAERITILFRGEMLTIEVSDKGVTERDSYIFRNSAGAYEIATLHGKKKITDTISSQKAVTAEGEYKRYNIRRERETEKYGYGPCEFFAEEDARKFLEELFLSEDIRKQDGTRILISNKNYVINSNICEPIMLKYKE